MQEFAGNEDRSEERQQFLNSPFIARYVRIHPTNWHRHIGLRAGLLGCPYVGEFPTLPRLLSVSFMVALWNRETIYIFILFLLLLLLFFARLISAVGDWMSTILRHMVWS